MRISIAEVGQAFQSAFMSGPFYDEANTAWPNKSYAPSPLTPWWAAKIVAVSRIRVGGGLNGCFHWTGNFQVDCYTQLGAGELPNWTALDVVLSYFDSVKTLTTTNGLVITLQGGTPTPSLTEKQWIHGIPVAKRNC